MPLSEKKVFVFDFDGTLVDSNKIKKDAFFQLTDNEQFNLILEKTHSKMPEVSRFILLRNVLEQMKHDDIQSEVDRLCSLYGSLVEEKTIACTEMPGAIELLKHLGQKKVNIYLSSNTPEISLKKIIYKRGWDQYFKCLYGSPRNKSETIKLISKNENLSDSSRIVVLGDGESDKLSAESICCDFVDVNSVSLVDVLKELRNV
ncbi:MAG: hypothetical protein CME70_21590 [Halobacteriovorax sp.]|nr:hypothetical protein [Halobacteriovorax sp.]|tara:strand:+ start:22417 stop:23025 length:609 start_codon:yes stop_codon:yes gene_type:complete